LFSRAGWGGWVIALIKKQEEEEFKEALLSQFYQATDEAETKEAETKHEIIYEAKHASKHELKHETNHQTIHRDETFKKDRDVPALHNKSPSLLFSTKASPGACVYSL